MPRLTPKAKPKDRYLRATRDVFGVPTTMSGISVLAGQFVRADHPSVKFDPDVFEELPPLEERAGGPGRDEAAAVAAVWIVDGGRMVMPGQRFWPDDPLVRRYPAAFAFSAPPR